MVSFMKNLVSLEKDLVTVYKAVLVPVYFYATSHPDFIMVPIHNGVRNKQDSNRKAESLTPNLKPYTCE